MKRIILFLLLALAPGLAFADLANELNSKGMNDLSFKYLQDIFGVVDGVLHGTGSQIMGAMFGAFNSAVLTLGFIIMSYVFFVSTINTAGEGEILGKKWSSIWIPLRIIGSTALIVPKASGYCVIQIFVMYVVVSGVSAANTVSGAALNYIQNGGVLIQSSPPPNSESVRLAGNILKSLTCMNATYNALLVRANQSDGKFLPPPRFIPSPKPMSNTNTIFFPASDTFYSSTPDSNKIFFGGFCGKVSWTDDKVDTGKTLNKSDPGLMRQVGVQQIIYDLQPFAQSLANSIVPVDSTIGIVPVKDVISAYNISLVLAAADYKGIMLPYFNQRKEALDYAAADIIKKTAKQGWIMLGTLYFSLAQLNNNVNGDDKNAPKAVYGDFTGRDDARKLIESTGNFNRIYCYPAGEATKCDDNVLTAKDSEQVNPGDTNYIDRNIALSSKNPDAHTGGDLYKAGYQSKRGGKSAAIGLQLLSVLVDPMIAPIYGIIYNMQALFDAENQNADPILSISGIGTSLVKLVTNIWFGLVGIITTAAVALSVVPCVNPGGFGVVSFLAWFVPTFSALLIGLFVAGATMGFYVPMIPFILFTFAAIGWFAVVIEAMIAAPLVALGIAAPEGHEIFGKAEPAILLLANVFLRPTLMVFGFFAGAILSHVGLWLLNKGFHTVWGWAVLANIGNLGFYGVLWALMAVIVIYISLVLAIINQTFGLIHQLPDELMRWLNGGLRALGSSPDNVSAGIKSEFSAGARSGAEGLQRHGEASSREREVDAAGGGKASRFTKKEREDGVDLP